MKITRPFWLAQRNRISFPLKEVETWNRVICDEILTFIPTDTKLKRE